ncbi:hypothetical protein [Pseudonocardia adelaidensis]|uniref:Uncharacterized protein n=1 Tax=Pseudonocardia adelaidensis TaxID=648754 RepID=A0ABP9NYN8_9PSEU
MGQYLRRDHPLSAKPVACTMGADYEWRAWEELRYGIRTGGNAAVHVLGSDVWEYRRRHPEHGEVFDAAMRSRPALPARVSWRRTTSRGGRTR